MRALLRPRPDEFALVERAASVAVPGAPPAPGGVAFGDIAFSNSEFHKRETTLLGGGAVTRADFDTVFAAPRFGAIPTHALAGLRASLDEAARAFPHWLDPASHVVKALIEI